MYIPNHQTLWRLYNNTSFRNEFFLDKEEFYEKYNVPTEIIHFLNDTTPYELANHAETILKDRMKKVKKNLPLTFKLLGKELQVHFLKFCDSYNRSNNNEQVMEAGKFVDYLLNHGKFSKNIQHNSYAKAILLFEQSQLKSILSERNDTELNELPFIPFQRQGRRYRRRGGHIQYFAESARWMRSKKQVKKKSKKKSIAPIAKRKNK